MDKETCLFISILTICVTAVIIMPTTMHYKFIENCINNDYIQVQNVGQCGYHWAKEGVK